MNDEHAHQRYTAALGLLNQERQLFWQTFGAFLLAHTVFMAFLLQTASRQGILWSWSPGVFVTSIIGLMLCGPWYMAHLRTWAYNDFRMAQAREVEPLSWKLLRDKGESFANGDPVNIGTPRYQMPWLVRGVRTMYAVTALIALFALFYTAIAFLTAPWWPRSASIPL
jgi:hypothetical protein